MKPIKIMQICRKKSPLLTNKQMARWGATGMKAMRIKHTMRICPLDDTDVVTKAWSECRAPTGFRKDWKWREQVVVLGSPKVGLPSGSKIKLIEGTGERLRNTGQETIFLVVYV
jgi:hypothetical protein